MPWPTARDTRRVTTVVEMFAASLSTLAFDDGTVETAPALAADATDVAGMLHDDGVRPGDRIGVHLANSADYVRLLLGAAAAGAIAVSINTRFSQDEVDSLVVRSGAASVYGADRRRELGEQRGGHRITPHTDADAGFVVFTTSGTTAAPKMALHSHRSITAHATDVAEAFGYRPDDVVMVAMPLCGTFGLASLMGAVAGGSRVVVTDFELRRTADLISRERVTCVNGSDDMFHRLLDVGADLSSIRLGGYARFNTSLDGIVGRAERAGALLTGLYGMSEVQALYSLRSPAEPVTGRERAGGSLVSAGAAYRIVDGELQLRGPSLFAGYLAEGGEGIDDELTGRAFADGWFRTGDLAEPDDERTFHYVARLGDALRLGGFLVSPSEIESVLCELPDVAAAQVVAVDRATGARPVAFVVAGDGTTVDETALIEHCATRLARYKVPVRVVTIDEFPTTPSANGTKIQKVRLREMAIALVDGTA